MIQLEPMSSAERIATIIHNLPLARAIEKSVASALGCSWIYLQGGNTEWDLFENSLNAAVRDIENHPRGILFRRLLEYGPQSPGLDQDVQNDGSTIVSDAECGTCVEFIFSHMVNHFKGELAELLALEPCLALFTQLKESERLPKEVQLYWGGFVQEKRRIKPSGKSQIRWGSFTKGADGLLAKPATHATDSAYDRLDIYGIIEIKSMVRPANKILRQIDQHLSRLKGGVKLGMREWSPAGLRFQSQGRMPVWCA